MQFRDVVYEIQFFQYPALICGFLIAAKNTISFLISVSRKSANRYAGSFAHNNRPRKTHILG